ncbi:hypothetical protein GYA19_05750 [Candidatus Beckwithbacteria bacterium]|nr:hypothetical protein [Candidatus Beckwithbacteria bacterium]
MIMAVNLVILYTETYFQGNNSQITVEKDNNTILKGTSDYQLNIGSSSIQIGKPNKMISYFRIALSPEQNHTLTSMQTNATAQLMKEEL